MNKIEFSTIQAGTGKTYVQCVTEHVDEDGVIETKRGFLQVVPDKAQSLLTKLQNGERAVAFGNRPNQQGLYPVTMLKAGVTATAENEVLEEQA